VRRGSVAGYCREPISHRDHKPQAHHPYLDEAVAAALVATAGVPLTQDQVGQIALLGLDRVKVAANGQQERQRLARQCCRSVDEVITAGPAGE
jgi:hypothetical protein